MCKVTDYTRATTTSPSTTLRKGVGPTLRRTTCPSLTSHAGTTRYGSQEKTANILEVLEIPAYSSLQTSGTHETCCQLFLEQADGCVPDEVFAKKTAITSETLLAMMRTRREEAALKASSLAQMAKSQTSSLPEAILNILDSRDVRRGTAKSSVGREKCLREIEAALAKSGPQNPLSLAVLTLPYRDQHPFKNVGQLPDAGEVEALIRFWTIGNAISCLGVPCKVMALRDGNRYPSGWHVSQETKTAYGDALQEIAYALSLEDYLVVQDVDDRTLSESAEAYEQRMEGHRRAYQEEMDASICMLGHHRDALLSATSEAEFIERMLELSRGKEFLPMFYAMLHSLPPSATPVAREFQGAQERRRLVSRIVNIFTPNLVEADEVARRQLLWEALVNTCEYVAAYRSRSSANNTFGLDDVAAVAPSALRMSIHNKSKDNGQQFPIQVGWNVHRTPWHGTAELRYKSSEKAGVINVKMAAEMWHTHVGVVPSTTSEAATSSEQDHQATSWNRYCARLENAQQPFFFADVSSLPANWQDPEVCVSLPKRVKQSVKELREKKRATKRARKASLGGA